MARTALMNVMVEAVRKASRGLTRDFGEVANLQVSVKGPGDFVTSADRRVEKVLREELERVRPGYGFLGEEGGEVVGSDQSHRWIVDPIDATTNFLHSNPVFAISVALERQGTLVAGVIYNPVTDELFTAERGGGAFMNDRRLRVANRSALADCLVGVSLQQIGRGNHAQNMAEIGALMNEVAGLRSIGCCSLSLAYVAAGRFDGYAERWISPWDCAAGVLMVREAGGFVSDYNGKDDMLGTGTVIAGNEVIQARLLDRMKKLG
jgi:myo-inositol-1(or 4)-monophosphatase